MTLEERIKNVIKDGDTAKQITNKICEKYHGYFVERVEYYNNDVKRTKEQINAEISSRMGNSNNFNIIRKQGQLNKYSATNVVPRKPKIKQKSLSARIEKLETDYKNLCKNPGASKKNPIKKRSWWSKWINRK